MQNLLSFNVLLVDDDPDSHVIVKAYLKKIENCEYRVDSIENFESAVLRLQNPAFEYDIVLLDHYLGDHTGIELLRDLHDTPLLPPVIILTGSDDKSLDTEALSLGASDFLVKNQINSALLDRAIRYAIEHRKNERLIIQKQREIAAKLKLAALGEIASAITHEINNPLSVIQARALMIKALADKNSTTDPKLKSCAEEILSMIDRIGEIKTGLKRQFSSPFSQSSEEIDLRNLLSEAIRLSENKRKQTRSSIFLLLEQDCSLKCRPTEISQVLVNLVNNAAEAIAFLEERWIRVEAHAESDFLTISVTDSGNGIPEEKARRLFESFYTTKVEGMGIGLNLSRKIIESHGGTLNLDVTSQNTRFVIRLPLRPLPLQLTPLKFLIVDDEPEILHLIRESIESRGHEAVLSSDPLEAKSLLQNAPFDVVITDIRLPKMSGIQLSEELSTTPSKDATLIFISGFIDGALRRKLNRQPNIGFFEKPFDIDQLVTRAVQMTSRDSPSLAP